MNDMTRYALVRETYEIDVAAERNGDITYAYLKRQETQEALRAEGIELETFQALYAQVAVEHMIDESELEALTYGG